MAKNYAQNKTAEKASNSMGSNENTSNAKNGMSGKNKASDRASDCRDEAKNCKSY